MRLAAGHGRAIRADQFAPQDVASASPTREQHEATRVGIVDDRVMEQRFLAQVEDEFDFILGELL